MKDDLKKSRVEDSTEKPEEETPTVAEAEAKAEASTVKDFTIGERSE